MARALSSELPTELGVIADRLIGDQIIGDQLIELLSDDYQIIFLIMLGIAWHTDNSPHSR